MKSLQQECRVTANRRLSERFYQITFESPELAREVLPGQFVHLRVADGWEPFFRRPFSVYRAHKKFVDVFYEVVGQGTFLLSQKKKGDVLDVLGPLGRPFDEPPSETERVIMVAGGIGVAPFLILSEWLKKRYSQKMFLFYGGRTQGHTFDMTVFQKNGCRVFISTDDGRVGRRGRVTQFFSQIKDDKKPTFIYTCGPKAMMKAVQMIASRRGFQGQAACEEVMACGLGACLGCSILTTSGWKTVCYDGPVFDLHEVVFD